MEIVAPLTGNVWRILVNEGDVVSAGDTLVILESMKMENEILAPKNGEVKKILVSVGQIVLKDELIMQIS